MANNYVVIWSTYVYKVAFSFIYLYRYAKFVFSQAIFYKKYSVQSDVWSFGCVMYEIWSLGYKPYEDLDTTEVCTLSIRMQF